MNTTDRSLREQVEVELGKAGLGICASDPKHTYYGPRGQGRLGVLIRVGSRGLRTVHRWRRAGHVEDSLVSPEVFHDRVDWTWLRAYADAFMRRATAQQRTALATESAAGESAQAW